MRRSLVIKINLADLPIELWNFAVILLVATSFSWSFPAPPPKKAMGTRFPLLEVNWQSIFHSLPLILCWRRLIPPPVLLKAMWSPNIHQPSSPQAANDDFSLGNMDGLYLRLHANYLENVLCYVFWQPASDREGTTEDTQVVNHGFPVCVSLHNP